MNELVYVLTVEALVFGTLCTILVAQRIDVFDWPPEHTWPVFSTCMQLILWYGAGLQMLCCFLAAGHDEKSAISLNADHHEIASNIQNACARSAGRLSTAVLLNLIYVGTLSVLYETDQRFCVLCQLWGKTCAQSQTFVGSRSYGVYLAVLLPVTALQVGLLITASGMCKLHNCYPCRRLCTAHCAFLLTIHVNYSLRQNTGLLSHCRSAVVASDASKMVMSDRVLGLAVMLCCLDILADMHASLKPRGYRRFGCIHLLQLISVVAFHLLYDEESLPLPLFAAHLGLSLLLAVLDVFELRSLVNLPAVVPASGPSLTSVKTLNDVEPSAPPLTVDKRSAFEVEPARRRRFVLAFNNKSRWPSAPPTMKKTI